MVNHWLLVCTCTSVNWDIFELYNVLYSLLTPSHWLDQCRLFSTLQIHLFQKLDLSNRGFDSMHHRAFCNAYNIMTLDISRNNLSELPYLCTLLRSIFVLHASFNRIHTIAFGYFDDFVHLEELYLARNRLGMTHEPDFSPLADTLRLIRLSGNPWGRVPRSLYNTTYPILWEVSLAGSQLSKLPREAVRSWPRLKIIRIQGNFIRCLSDLRNATKNSRMTVYVGNNPLHCGLCMVSNYGVSLDVFQVTCHCENWIKPGIFIKCKYSLVAISQRVMVVS